MKAIVSMVTALLLTLVAIVMFPVDVAAATVRSASTTTSQWVGYLTMGAGALGTTLATTHPTLLDLRNVIGPDDKVSRVIEILDETNEILQDAVALESNELTSHVTTVRTGIPLPTWRKLYGGVQPSKSTTAKIRDSIGMLENYAEVDKALADLAGNANEFRLQESRPILEGFNEEVADSLFFADEDTEPETFTGLAPRFNSFTAENAANVIDGGGAAADHTSIWLVLWSENTCHLLYPKGSKAGIQVTDKGVVTIENVDGNGGRMEGYRTHFRWDIGLCVRDWRYIVRVANISKAALKADLSSGPDLPDLMVQALEQIKSTQGGRLAFYMNRTLRSMLRRQVTTKGKYNITTENVAGKHMVSFDGVPVRRCDVLTFTEGHVQ